MTTMEKYKKAKADVDSLAKKIVEELSEGIAKIPNISWVKPMGIGFTIPASKLSSRSWLPDFYSKELMVKEISKNIQGKSLEKIQKYLNEVCDGNMYHPDLISELEKVMKNNGIERS